MKETEDILVFSPLGASGCSKKANKNMTYNPQGLIENNVKKKNNAKRLGKFLHNPEHMGAGNKLLHESEYEQKFTNYPSEIIEKLKSAKLIVVEGTLYPLLTRLKNEELLTYRWEESNAGPPRKYYALTKIGKAFLEELDATWDELQMAVNEIVKN
jgi:PadR family transcriptional regulator PadR